jgi:hypothetical protein
MAAIAERRRFSVAAKNSARTRVTIRTSTPDPTAAAG